MAAATTQESEADALLWREIAEQPRRLSDVAARRRELAAIGERLWSGRPPLAVLVARGTSDNAATYARYLIEALLEVPVSLAAPSVYTLYGATPRLAGAVVLACSQSGASPDLIEVVARARQAGATTVALVNQEGSALAAAAEIVVDIGAGPERSVAATKSFTAELMTLAGLVLPAAHGAAAGGAREAFERLPAAVHEVLGSAGAVAAWADSKALWNKAYVVGRGFSYPVALEIALKLKEMAGVVAEGYSAADVRHGPIALSGPDLPFLLVGGRGAALGDLKDLARAAAAAQSPTVALSDDPSLRALTAESLALPELPESLAPIAAAVLGQMAAYRWALARGVHPGAPPAAIRKVTRTL